MKTTFKKLPFGARFITDGGTAVHQKAGRTHYLTMATNATRNDTAVTPTTTAVVAIPQAFIK